MYSEDMFLLLTLQKDATELKKKEGLKSSFLVYGKNVLVRAKESGEWTQRAIYLLYMYQCGGSCVCS